MVERLERQTCNTEVPGSSPTLTTYLFFGSPEFKSSASLVNSQLVHLMPAGILIDHVMFYLKYLFLPLLSHYP